MSYLNAWWEDLSKDWVDIIEYIFVKLYRIREALEMEKIVNKKHI